MDLEKIGGWDEGEMIRIDELTVRAIIYIWKMLKYILEWRIDERRHELWELVISNGADVYTRMHKEREVRTIR